MKDKNDIKKRLKAHLKQVELKKAFAEIHATYFNHSK